MGSEPLDDPSASASAQIRRRLLAAVVTIVAAAWLGADIVSRFQVVSAVTASAAAGDREARFLEWLAGTPSWSPIVVLLLALGALFVPSALWKRVLGLQLDRRLPQQVTPAPVSESPPAKSGFNHLETRFHGEVINIADFVLQGKTPTIRGKTFDDCVIYGPAVLLKVNSRIDGTNNLDGLSGYFEVQDETGLPGVILVEDCAFRNCDFRGVGVVLTNSEIKRLPNAQRPRGFREALKAENHSDG